MSELTDSNSINILKYATEFYHNPCMLIKPNSGDAQYVQSTLSTNNQGKSFWELVYGSVN